MVKVRPVIASMDAVCTGQLFFQIVRRIEGNQRALCGRKAAGHNVQPVSQLLLFRKFVPLGHYKNQLFFRYFCNFIENITHGLHIKIGIIDNHEVLPVTFIMVKLRQKFHMNSFFL